MPTKPMVPCKHPGCPELVPSGAKYCEKHKELHPEETRPAADRGYGGRWRKTRKAFLRHTRCVRSARRKANIRKQQWWTTSFLTDEIQSSFGTVKDAIIINRKERTRRQRIIIEKDIYYQLFGLHPSSKACQSFGSISGLLIALSSSSLVISPL